MTDLTEQQILTPAEAGAALDNMIKEYRGAHPSATPTDAAGAAARLAALHADPDWGKRLTSGDLATRREWQQLTTLIASGDHPADFEIETVDGVTDPHAVPRRVYNGMIDALREQGLPEDAEKYIRDFDAGRRTDRPTAAEGIEARQMLNRLIKDAEWMTKFARGDLAAKNQFNALNRTIAYAADADR